MISDERLEQISQCSDVGALFAYEQRQMARELLALRKACQISYGFIAEYPAQPVSIGGITHSFHDNREDAQEEAEEHDGFCIEVIRKPKMPPC